ncbi:MAG: class I SAM-dependent methyltransferase [Anaerolineae bacterium]|nr:class I SAM-dependent methyltransferase [Anaerolineae bacterium]
MEIVRGKQTSFINSFELAERLNGYTNLHIDIGTGDGRFVEHIARSNPKIFVIGIDACRENLQKISHHAPDNALFVIANALALPAELNGLAGTVTINFPWGSLLGGLLDNETGLLTGLRKITRAKAALEVRLNGGALAEAGWSLEEGTCCIQDVLAQNGFAVRSPVWLTPHDLRACPTSWAKRLAFGRDPRAAYLKCIKL